MKSKYAKQAGLITLALALMFSTVLTRAPVCPGSARDAWRSWPRGGALVHRAGHRQRPQPGAGRNTGG